MLRGEARDDRSYNDAPHFSHMHPQRPHISIVEVYRAMRSRCRMHAKGWAKVSLRPKLRHQYTSAPSNRRVHRYLAYTTYNACVVSREGLLHAISA